jgi:cytochrome P450
MFQSSHTMSSQIFLMPFFVFLTSILIFLLIKQRNKLADHAKRLPPGPTKLPLIGNLHQLGDLPHRSFQHLSDKHGPLMFLQLGSIPTLVISSAGMAREVFKTHDRIFSGRPVLFAAKKLSYNNSTMSFAPFGEYWREIRKLLILEILSARRVQTFQIVREEEVALMIDSVAVSLDPVNLSELTLLLTNNIVCRAAFGKKYDGGGGVYDIMCESEELLGGFCIADFFPWMGWLNKLNGLETRLEKNFRKLDELYENVIEEHLDPTRPEPEHEDLVDVLLRLQKDSNQAIALDNEKIKAVLTVSVLVNQ